MTVTVTFSSIERDVQGSFFVEYGAWEANSTSSSGSFTVITGLSRIIFASVAPVEATGTFAIARIITPIPINSEEFIVEIITDGNISEQHGIYKAIGLRK